MWLSAGGVRTRMHSSSGKSIRSRFAICSGLHDLAQRRSARRPCRRPIQRTSGPGTAAPSGLVIVPASRSCTYSRRARFAASFATFGRRARRSACHWAAVARYSSRPPRVAAFRRSSREIVDGDRAVRLAISRTPHPPARKTAISSRSANDKYRPDSGARLTGRIPPLSRNQRVPTTGDTPASMPASSLGIPLAIATQNRCRPSRPATGGRPGERIADRPVAAAAHPLGRPIHTSRSRCCDDRLACDEDWCRILSVMAHGDLMLAAISGRRGIAAGGGIASRGSAASPALAARVGRRVRVTAR